MSSARTPPRSAHNALRTRLSNVILMIPDTDWTRVLAGDKRMFRSYSRRITPTIVPTPVVAYRYRVGDVLETSPLWLEETWQEPLGAITPHDVAQEGFSNLSDFRRYFAERYPKGGYRPLAPVQVYRVRPITEDDRLDFAYRLLERMGY